MPQKKPSSRSPPLPPALFARLRAAGWDGPRSLATANSKGQPLLSWVLSVYAHDDVLEELLRRPALLVERDDKEATPLHVAARCRKAWVPRLLAAGADPNASDQEGTTPLHLAARHADAETVRALLAAGAEPLAIAKSGTALHHAAQGADPAVIDVLLSRGLPPDAGSNTGGDITPLMLASFAEGECAQAERLLAAGADPLAHFFGRSVLLYAVLSATPRTFTWIIDRGADIENDLNGFIPLLSAAQHNPVLVPVLLDAGAKPDRVDAEGVNALKFVLDNVLFGDARLQAEGLVGLQALLSAGLPVSQVEARLSSLPPAMDEVRAVRAILDAVALNETLPSATQKPRARM